jgi:hypothetical protein
VKVSELFPLLLCTERVTKRVQPAGLRKLNVREAVLIRDNGISAFLAKQLQGMWSCLWALGYMEQLFERMNNGEVIVSCMVTAWGEQDCGSTRWLRLHIYPFNINNTIQRVKQNRDKCIYATLLHISALLDHFREQPTQLAATKYITHYYL